MFSRMGSAAYKKDLFNIRLLCRHLGHPENKIKTIHVAGTNGKGSVSHMLAAIFQEAGYKTGLYTSPHLYDFRERVRINGEMISQAFVVHFVEKIKPLIEEIEPSFFEITVAMAFEAFVGADVEIAIIEVGLGGRLDSTNIITPELSIITNIGWDHMNLLGNSLEEIAVEKAGIIKENIPVVIGETMAQTKPVFQQIASEKNAPLLLAEEAYVQENYALNETSLSIQYKQQNENVFSIETDLQGIYQTANVRTVLTAADALNKMGWNLTETAVKQALKNVKTSTGLGGRWDVIQQKPAIVLEVAHNQQGIEKMLEHLKQITYNRLHLIIGMVKDKEIEKVLQMLPQNAQYYFTQAAIPRALPAVELQHLGKTLHLNGDSFDNVNLALQAAKQKADVDDLILVCGSIFLVAEVDKH